MSTADMKCCMALETGCTGALFRFAQFANCIVSKCWRSNALYHVEAGSTTEPDLGVPYRTINMHPVVVRGTLEWLARNERAAFLLLPKSVIFFGSVDKLFLHSLLFSVALSLFLVRDFGLLEEVLLSVPLRAKNTFVRLSLVSRW